MAVSSPPSSAFQSSLKFTLCLASLFLIFSIIVSPSSACNQDGGGHSRGSSHTSPSRGHGPAPSHGSHRPHKRTPPTPRFAPPLTPALPPPSPSAPISHPPRSHRPPPSYPPPFVLPSPPTPPSVPAVPSAPTSPILAPPAPTIPTVGTCPVNLVKLNVCVPLLGGILGNPLQSNCCALLGIIGLDVEVCLCLAIDANVLGLITIHAKVDAIATILTACGYTVPPNLVCP